MYYISHHGIEGQKWGVRHGPPYPLDRQSPKERSTVKSKSVSYAGGRGDNLAASSSQDFDGVYDKPTQIKTKISNDLKDIYKEATSAVRNISKAIVETSSNIKKELDNTLVELGLKERKISQKQIEEYHKKMDEKYDEIRKLSEKEKTETLRKATAMDPDDDGIEAFQAITNEIEKVYDWHDSKPKTAKMKRIDEEYRKVFDDWYEEPDNTKRKEKRKALSKEEDKISKALLEELDIKPTKENIELIYSIWNWD